ncbi:hypothetical protein MSWH1_1314 [Methanosarcina sp. WH1]|nr:hypothetical protein MSWH1_1314 [Methanosarcina sp. WH1]
MTDFTTIISPASIIGVILPLNTTIAFSDPVKSGIKALIRNIAITNTIAIQRLSFFSIYLYQLIYYS